MPVYRDEAVVLRTHKLGEADRIVTLLTRRHGKVRAVAKGVRRTASKFGARLEPFMVADVQLYEGRTLDIVTQAESLGSYGADHRSDYAATRPRTPWSRRPTGSPRPRRSLQQYLLLVGALRSLAARRARAEPHPRLLPAARARPRGLGAELPGLRALRARRARTPPSSCSSAAWSATTARPPGAPRIAPPRSRCSARCWRATGRTPRRGTRRDRAPGERHRRRLRPVAPRARPALAAARLPRNDRRT